MTDLTEAEVSKRKKNEWNQAAYGLMSYLVYLYELDFLEVVWSESVCVMIFFPDAVWSEATLFGLTTFFVMSDNVFPKTWCLFIQGLTPKDVLKWTL